MNTHILDQIPFNPDIEKIYEALRIRPNTSGEKLIDPLVDEASTIGRPRAIYRLAFVEKPDERTVKIEGEQFTSKLMVRNLQDVNRVFAYVATCGRELLEWEESQPDMLSRFYAYTINNFALISAMAALSDHLTEKFQIGKHATMNPGSLEDWPIIEQRPLFRLLGDVEASIGVELTDGCVMVPGQSVSGVLFETEREYVNCQLCPRKNCPNRRAPYEEALYSEIFD